MIANKTKEITRLNSVYNSLLKNAGVDYLEGKGSLVDAHTVKVHTAGHSNGAAGHSTAGTSSAAAQHPAAAMAVVSSVRGLAALW